jgi:hypothetical protein
LVEGDSMALTERYAGRPQPMRLETGEARPKRLKKMRRTDLRVNIYI